MSLATLAAVAHWTGVPLSNLLEGEEEKLLRLAEHLHKRGVGQDEAVDALADAVIQPAHRRVYFSRTRGLERPSWPGALAEFMFDDDPRRCVRNIRKDTWWRV